MHEAYCLISEEEKQLLLTCFFVFFFLRSLLAVKTRLLRNIVAGEGNKHKLIDGLSLFYSTIPYHTISNNLKTVWGKFALKVIYRNDLRLLKLFTFLGLLLTFTRKDMDTFSWLSGGA